MEKKKSGNFFQTLIDSLFGGNDPEAIKRKKLRNIAKSLNKTRYSKFYRYQGNEALPAMAKFFYEIYRVIYPAQTMFQSLQNPNILKGLAINFYTTEDIRKIEESLSEENITNLAKKIPTSNLETETEKRISEYSEYFTQDKIARIDNLYMQLSTMKDFCTFDFYFLLKKFKKGLQEADFSSTINFEKINAEYISGEIRDFISVAWTLPFDSDWTNCIKLLRAFKGVEPVTLQNWKRVISRLQSLKSSYALEYIVRLIEGNPTLTFDVTNSMQNIIEPYIDKIKASAESALEKIVRQERENKTENLASQLFENIEVLPLKNYNENWNITLRNKHLSTFNNVDAMKYLKTFLIEIFKKDVREFYDLILVRGQWDSQALASPFSESYNWILGIIDKILEFDASLAEDTQVGIKIKTLLPKTDRDSSSKNIANRLINDANKTAYSFIAGCTKNLITMGRIIKSLVEDYSKPKPTIIANWKELEKYAETPIKEMCVSLYKKIYLFVSLMQTTVVQMETDD